MRILIVAPTLDGISSSEEYSSILASTWTARVLSGMVPVALLDSALQEAQFDILHFVQHGNFSLLQFSDGTVAQERLVRMIKRTQRELKLVLVNACNSAGTGAALANGLGCTVIAHEVPVNNELAVVFARELYAALASGAEIQPAFNDAYAIVLRRAVAMEKTEQFRPLLLLGRNSRDDEMEMSNVNVPITDPTILRLTTMTDEMRLDIGRIGTDVEIIKRDVASLDRRLSRIEERMGQSNSTTWQTWLVLGVAVLLGIVAMLALSKIVGG